MKITNHQLFNFLNMDVALKEGEVLWKSCSPTSIIGKGNDIILEIPFQKQKVSADIVPD